MRYRPADTWKSAPHEAAGSRSRDRFAERDDVRGLAADARALERAGADALELNFYFVATEPAEDAQAVEQRVLDVVAVVKESVSIPLAVKLSPFYSSLPNMAARLDRLGADGLVLFNRFYQTDIDPETRRRRQRCNCPIRPIPAASACDGHPVEACPPVAGPQRRRPRAAGCGEGGHGGRARGAAGLDAPAARPGAPRIPARAVRGMGRRPRLQFDSDAPARRA